MCACSLEDTVKPREENNSNSLEETTAEIMSFESRVRTPLKKRLTVMILQKGKQDPRTLFHLLIIFIMIFLKKIRMPNR